MAFSDILIDTTFARQGNSEFTDYSDLELQSMNFELSYDDLKEDLIDMLGLDISETETTTILDAIYTKYTNKLKKALMYKQLYYYFKDTSQGEGSKSYEKMRDYEAKYNIVKNSFANLATSNYQISTIIPTGRL